MYVLSKDAKYSDERLHLRFAVLLLNITHTSSITCTMSNSVEAALITFSLKDLRLSQFSVATALGVITVLFFLRFRNVGRREKDFPPGPRTTAILGNALDFPKSFPHVK